MMSQPDSDSDVASQQVHRPRTKMNKPVSEVQLHLDRRKRLKRPWWFISFTFPLICAAFAPLANLFSVLSFVEPWVVVRFKTSGPRDPPWLLAINSVALATAVIANVTLLLGFARRVRNIIAQPLTVALWYISGILHIVALCLTNAGPNTVPSQSYYYALLSCIMHFGMGSLLLLSYLPSLPIPFFRGVFPAYPSRALSLTAPQRTLMIQSLFFTLYLASGAGVFAALNHWAYLDAIYWTDYSLLTIGFGSDFTVVSNAAKAILIPYLALGIFMLGLVIGSIRSLFLESFRDRMLWGKEIVQKERERWWRSRTRTGKSKFWRALRCCYKTHHNNVPRDEGFQVPMKWSKEEWELMKVLKNRADTRRRYVSLLVTSTLFFVIWFGGAVIFAFTERAQDGFTYPLSLYFTYVSLFTVGYGDVVPRSNAGKPVFVLWSLASIPAVTLLVSDVQDTFAKWVKEGPVEHVFGRWLVGSVTEDECPARERADDGKDEELRDRYDGLRSEKARDGYVPDYKEKVQKARTLLHMLRKILEHEEQREYSWEEWEIWIKMLELDKDGGYEQGHVSNWTWLGDDGPLLAPRESENIWLLERFRQKLDEELGSILSNR